MKPETLAEPVLVGRSRELERLQVYLKEASKGRGATVFVSGEAGSGKTRLANEFLTMAKKKNVTVLSGWCLSNAAVPYFPFLEAFGSYYSRNEPEGERQLEIKTWLTGTSQTQEQGKYENLNAQAWKDKTFAAVIKQLLFLSTNKPVILFIDDIHWADSASLALLHYISRGISSERILTLATYRSEEILSKQTDGGSYPLVENLRLMGRDELFSEIPLHALCKDEVGKIAESMLGGTVDSDLVAKLSEDSGGNPLSVVESLRMMFEQRNLSKKDGQWRLEVDKIGLPGKVKDVIMRRLDALKPAQRRVVDAASVLGEKFSPDLVASVINQEYLDVLDALNAMEQGGRLVVGEGNGYRFEHAKIREILYNGLSPLMKIAFHLRIAKKMEEVNQTEKKASLSDIAYHYIQAGDKEKSLKYSLAAGIDALVKFSNTEAIKHFSYVLQNLTENPENDSQRMAALEGLGDAHYAGMKFKEAAKTFESLSKIEGANKLRALRKAMEASFFQNDLAKLEELLKEAEKCDLVDRLENARVLHNKARVFTLHGRMGYGIENSRKALQIFQEEYSVWDTAWTLIALGSTLPHIGQPKEGLAALLRSIAMFRELGDSRWLIEAYNMAAICGMQCGLQQEVKGLVEKAIRINEDEKINDYLRLSQSNAILAWLIASPANLQEALDKSLKALYFAEKTDSYWAQGTACSNLTTYYTMLEDGKHAEEYFGKLMKLPPDVHLNAMVNAPIATAYYLASKNQWEQATKVFDSMLAHYVTDPNPGAEAIIRMSYAWVLSKQGRFEEAKKQAEKAKVVHDEMTQRFDHLNVYATLMAPANVLSDQVFEVRLDLVNVSRTNCQLIRIENLLPREFRLVSPCKNVSFEDDVAKLKKNRLEPFEVSTVKLKVQATKTGIFNLSPRVLYVSDLKENKSAAVNSTSITVSAVATSQCETEPAPDAEQARIEFESENSRRVFNYLAKAFNEDYKVRKLMKERSGWRTMMDIVKAAKVSKNSIYGPSGRHGHLIAGLEQRGILETRVFDGERGRGGKIVRARIAYEKEAVRREVCS